MKNTNIFFILISFLLLFFTGCSNNNKVLHNSKIASSTSVNIENSQKRNKEISSRSQISIEEMNIYQGVNYKIKFFYPKTWIKNLVSKNSVTFQAPSYTKQSIQPNLTVVMQDLGSTKLNYSEFFNALKSSISKQYTNSSFEDPKDTQISNLKGKIFTYSCIDKGIKLKYQQYCTVKYSTLYTWTFITSFDTFDSYQQLILKIINSINIQ